MAQTKPRVLYVDEDAEDGFTLTTRLRLAGYEPVTANFASDALQMAQTDDFDLYILSRRFPADSGESLCQKLNQIAPRTPVIFLPDDAGGILAAVGRALLAAG
jgi:DNA-binding response OmpR family regulator